MNKLIDLPKHSKMSITTYIKRHYPFNDISRQTVINQLKDGRLFGVFEGKWYVYVDTNGYPIAFATPSIMKKPTAAEQLANAILNKHGQ